MLARTKGIGAGGFRARPADGCPGGNRWRVTLAQVGRAPGPHRWSPGSAAQHQGAPTASGPGAVCSSRGATRTGSAGAARRARHCPKAIRVTWRLPQAGHHTVTTRSPRRVTPTATTSATRSRAQRGQAQTAVAGPPPGAARQCRAGVVMEHSEQARRRSAARCRRSSRASSAPCSLNNTTNGPNHAATSASTSSASPATTKHPPSEQEAHPAALTA